MDAQAAIIASKLTRVREMREEIARLREENATLRAESATLRAHFDLALLAATDLAALPATGRFIVVDGWNRAPGAERRARDPSGLVARWRDHLAAHPDDFVWIVLDGPRANAREEGRLRVSYTGGTGAQRADRLIIDFLRFVRLRGASAQVVVETADKELLKRCA